ncbi:DUF488 family protein, partial [Elizabethkingia meningoseptica]|uniref:DUF488 family protein, N3 subclade n=1 Tax=Elizabethkingia meningoseptica TaxID=238 RepID=UPI003158F201
QEMRDQYRAVKNGWDEYARQYLELMREREIENKLDKSLFDERTVFLCTEPIQQHCHRRLLVEYLNSTWGNVSSIPL